MYDFHLNPSLGSQPRKQKTKMGCCLSSSDIVREFPALEAFQKRKRKSRSRSSSPRRRRSRTRSRSRSPRRRFYSSSEDEGGFDNWKGHSSESSESGGFRSWARDDDIIEEDPDLNNDDYCDRCQYEQDQDEDQYDRDRSKSKSRSRNSSRNS